MNDDRSKMAWGTRERRAVLATGLLMAVMMPSACAFSLRPGSLLPGRPELKPPMGMKAVKRPGAACARAARRFISMQAQQKEDASTIVAAPEPPPNVVCVEGSSGPVCTLVDEDAPQEMASGGGYWAPRVLFLLCCIAYGTNFALGRSMNEALDPSVTYSVHAQWPRMLHAEVWYQ